MSDSNSDLGAFLSGLIIGALVGAATALLLAPQSGEDTRMLIRDKSIELKNQAADTAEEARARAEELAKRGQVVYEEQRGKIETAIKTGRSALTKKADESGEKPTEPAAE